MFRFIGAFIFLLGFGTSFYFRRKSETIGEPVSFQEEGLFVMITLRVAGLAMWLSVIIWLLNPQWMIWSQLALPPLIRWGGVGLGFICLPLTYWLFSSIGTNITQTVETRPDHALVTSGPYHYVRHPLYTVGITMFISFALMAANWFIALTTVAVLVMLLIRLPVEEAKLIERFGDDYRHYMRNTGKLLPRIQAKK
ncbi:MAG: isoprenylcysteine carboxylmethyltransferase family protein [Anaerolineales bacterium]|jgi:isoprenylcysteine carboxyl methyltransferase (ICMT) family protein YpbQ